MKILLTLFVLLFAIPAYSSDDLTGNKIVCSKVDGELIYLTGFKFIGNFDVIHYQVTNRMPLQKKRVKYETSPEKIMIETNTITEYHINRKNLSITRNNVMFRNDNFQYENGECRLHDASIQDFLSKKLEKYKEGNLL